jgi:hypothetical protein
VTCATFVFRLVFAVAAIDVRSVSGILHAPERWPVTKRKLDEMTVADESEEGIDEKQVEKEGDVTGGRGSGGGSN